MKKNWNEEHWFLSKYQKVITIYDKLDMWNEVIQAKNIKLRPQSNINTFGFQHYFDWKYYINNGSIYSFGFDILNSENEIKSLLINSDLSIENNYFIKASSNLPLLKIKTKDLIQIYDEVFELSRNVLLISENGLFFIETNKKYIACSNFEIYPKSKLDYFSGSEWLGT